MEKNKSISKICFSVNKISLSGGAERVICNLASNFAEKGIETTIITQENTESGYPLHKDVKVVATKTSCRIPGVRLLVRCLKLRKLVKEINPDVLISFMTLNNIIAIISTLGIKVPLICSERIYPGVIKGIMSHLRRFTYPLSEGFVFQTEHAKEFFNKKIQKRSTVIFNPLVDNIPKRCENTVKSIVTAGRMTTQKNHALLIKAFKLLLEKHPDYKLIIYGKGEEKANLELLIKNLNLQDNVILPGTSNTLLKDISNAAMFVLSSDYEGMPNVLAEAMAIGLPCVSTDCVGGGAKALIENRINGILVPCGDEELLCNAMSEIISDEEFAKNLGIEAAKIKSSLSSSNIALQWLDYIQKIVFKD